MPPEARKPYRSPHGRHRHYCPKCGTIWEHENSVIELPCTLHLEAHLCPACDYEEYDLYHGDSPPDACDHHENRKPVHTEHRKRNRPT